MNHMEIFEHLTDIDDALIMDADSIPVFHKRRILPKFILVAALMSIMVVTVVAVAIARAEIVVVPTDAGYTVTFRNLDVWPVEHSDWYPQNLPVGYEEKEIGSYEYHSRSIAFVDDDDGKLMFTYGPARYMPSYTIESGASCKRIHVGNYEAYSFSTVKEQIRYHEGKSSPIQVYEEWLFWVEGERKMGFLLRYVAMEKLDLITIAESVVQVDSLVAFNQDNADAAIVKLGDYQPQWIPTGYEYITTYGSPINTLMNPDYPGYVHSVYRNERNYEVNLFYEFVPKHRSSIAGTIIDIETNHIQESIDLNGILATYYETPWGAARAIVWKRQDVEGVPLTFTLYSDGISSTESISKEDLVCMAESIVMINAADTSHFELQGG